MPQIVHFGARTGFVQELQMSHRQTWLTLRLMFGGSLGVKLLGPSPGFRWVTRLCRAVRPRLHRWLASWLRARRGTARTGLPLCCHSALQARETPWEAVPGAARVGDPSIGLLANPQLA